MGGLNRLDLSAGIGVGFVLCSGYMFLLSASKLVVSGQ